MKDADWINNVKLVKPTKQQVTLRIDRDVLEYFRSTGKGWQSRINNVLRAYMEAVDKG
jgi:uncharacterized protein (DUF4415 family)